MSLRGCIAKRKGPEKKEDKMPMTPASVPQPGTEYVHFTEVLETSRDQATLSETALRAET